MKFNRKIVRKEGGVEVRLSFLFSEEELSGVDRIKDDPNVGISGLRIEGDEDQKTDFFLTYLRLLCHWVRMWNSRDHYQDIIVQSIGKRKNLESRLRKKRR